MGGFLEVNGYPKSRKLGGRISYISQSIFKETGSMNVTSLLVRKTKSGDKGGLRLLSMVASITFIPVDRKRSKNKRINHGENGIEDDLVQTFYPDNASIERTNSMMMVVVSSEVRAQSFLQWLLFYMEYPLLIAFFSQLLSIIMDFCKREKERMKSVSVRYLPCIFHPFQVCVATFAFVCYLLHMYHTTRRLACYQSLTQE